MIRLVKVVKAGGVSKAVSSDWDENSELAHQMERAATEITRELLSMMRVSVGKKYHDGDYVKRRIEVVIPDND